MSRALNWSFDGLGLDVVVVSMFITMLSRWLSGTYPQVLLGFA